MSPTYMNLIPSSLEGNSSLNLTWYQPYPRILVNYSVEVVSSHSSYRLASINDNSQSVVLDLDGNTLYTISILLRGCSINDRSNFTLSEFIVNTIYKSECHFFIDSGCPLLPDVLDIRYTVYSNGSMSRQRAISGYKEEFCNNNQWESNPVTATATSFDGNSFYYNYFCVIITYLIMELYKKSYQKHTKNIILCVA